jgi:hypothetical protein
MRKVTLIILSIVAFVSLITYISRNSKINIGTIEVTGNKIIDTKLIKDIADEKLSGRYLKLFPKTNFLLYPKKSIEENLREKFKRLKDISIKLKDINTLEIDVTERTPSYTWCGVVPPTSNDSTQSCYFLDDSGFIFDEAPYFSGDVYLRFYGKDGLEGADPLGHSFLPQSFNNLITYENLVLQMGLKPKAFFITEDGDIKMLLPRGAGASSDPEVIFKQDADFNKVAENLQAALGTEPLHSNFKNKYSSLLYIDLRFGNKVYFKFR